MGVEHTQSDPSSPMVSHAQPEPKRVTAALANFVLKSLNDPQHALIASASSSDGSPPPPLPAVAMIVQNRLWL